LQVANILPRFLTALPFVGSQNCKHWRTIQLKNVVVLKIHAALEELKPQLTTLNHIKYNFDVLERDYLPEEKDLRREESPER
jgi:hypothetical protein